MTKASQQQADILDRLNNGDPISKISVATHVRRPEIRRIAEDNHLTVRRGRPRQKGSETSRQRIIDTFWHLFQAQSIESLEQIAGIVTVSKAYVSAVLAREDIAAAELIAMVRTRRAAKLNELRSSIKSAKDLPK